MEQAAKANDTALAGVGANKVLGDAVQAGRDNWLKIEAHDRFGNLLWQVRAHNVLTSEGLDYLLGAALLGVTPASSWFLALIGTGGTVSAAHTYASHAGWTENTDYDEAARQAWTGVDTGVGTADNSASKAVFTIATGGATIAGVSFVSDATKGDSAASAVLYSESLFGSERALQESDTLTIQYTQSVA